jgi:hypothetical protein
MSKNETLSVGTSSKLDSKVLTEHVRRKYHRPGNGALLIEEELAAVLGEEPRTIRTWRHDGIIPAVVVGHRTIRYRLEAVMAALRKREVREVV